jgi:hypothetical protein
VGSGQTGGSGQEAVAANLGLANGEALSYFDALMLSPCFSVHSVVNLAEETFTTEDTEEA